MAGGPHAETVACVVCMTDHRTLTRAERTSEGFETDEYRCEKGHTFGIDWSAANMPAEPQWPASEALEAYVEAR